MKRALEFVKSLTLVEIALIVVLPTVVGVSIVAARRAKRKVQPNNTEQDQNRP